MNEPTKIYTPTDTTKFFDDLNKVLYVLGLRNFWIEDVKLPRRFVKVFDVLYPIIFVLQWIFCLLQFGGVFTQKHLTPTQRSDALVYDLCEPLTHLFCLKCIYNKKQCRLVLYYLAVVLKELYNHKETEKCMIKKMKQFLMVFSLSAFFNWVYYGVQATIEMVRSDAKFIPIITAWPDVTDTSATASYGRIILYILYCFSFYRLLTVFIIVLVLFVGLSHQYMNLCRYFESLNDIFEDEMLSHEEMESKFETALVMGIRTHADTLWCAKESQKISSGISSLIVFLATFIMPIMLNFKNIDDICARVTKLLISILIMGFYMWNAGDVTVEALKLPAAIFNCGWYRCRGKSSTRIRSLVVVTMMQAQKPVVFTAFGVVELSYETFVTIIKTAYSMVSVFY